MARRGCISVDRLPLQILLRDHPAWAGTPVAVTREEKPQSPILALNRAAREKGLAPGMKYSSALSLVPDLRAREVPPARVEQARALIVRTLFSFTPDIEPCPFDPDAFWVSIDGLRSLFPSESRWIEMVRGALAADGFKGRVVAGFTRFGTYAIARSRPGSMVTASRAEEKALTGRSSIDILPLSPRHKSLLRKLEVRTVQQFVSLPAQQIARRFGKEAALLRPLILSDDPLPIPSAAVKETIACRRHFDAPVVDAGLLLAHIDELLAAEARRAEAERSVISGLALILRTEDGETTTDLIRPAFPTLQTQVFRRLVELRLSVRQFSSGVQDIEIRSATSRPSRVQGELFTVRRRDLDAGARAFAAIRARFGNGAVTCARPGDSHLPERSFSWVPMERPALPAPREEVPAADHSMAVRRILFEPRQERFDGRRLGERRFGERAGPFVVSGSWWGTPGNDAAYFRDYYFTSSPTGIVWRFVDRLDGHSWIQGEVD